MLSRLVSQAVYEYSYIRNVMDMYTGTIISIYVYPYIYVYIYIYIFICVYIVYHWANITFRIPVIFICPFRIASSIPSKQNITLSTYIFRISMRYLHDIYTISTRCLHICIHDVYTISTLCLHIYIYIYIYIYIHSVSEISLFYLYICYI